VLVVVCGKGVLLGQPSDLPPERGVRDAADES
jgi:hypothetical protein